MPSPRTAAEWWKTEFWEKFHMYAGRHGEVGPDNCALCCAVEGYARHQVAAALAAVCKMVRGHATRIAEADKGKWWPTNETAADVGLLTALAMEIETFVIGR